MSARLDAINELERRRGHEAVMVTVYVRAIFDVRPAYDSAEQWEKCVEFSLLRRAMKEYQGTLDEIGALAERKGEAA